MAFSLHLTHVSVCARVSVYVCVDFEEGSLLSVLLSQVL